MQDRCDGLDKLLKEQEIVIKRHITKHQYYTHKETMNEAIQDFIDKYAWVMREIYCNSSCSKSKECSAYQNYLKNNSEIEKEVSNK